MAMFMQQAAGIPMPFARKVKQLRALARSLRLDADDILPDEAETKKMGEQMDNQGPPPNPEMERIKLRQAEIADKSAEREHALLIENERNKLRLAEIASRENLTMEQARTKYGIEALKAEGSLQDRREQRQHDAQALNAELATKLEMGSGI